MVVGRAGARTRAGASRWSSCSPVVRISSPPDSHGVGSGSSVMCTQRTGASAASSPLASSSPISSTRVRSVSIARRRPCCLGPARLSCAAIFSEASVSTVAQDARRSPRTARVSGDQRRRELDHRVAAVVGAADQAVLVQRAREEAAQQQLRLLVVEALLGLLVLDQLDRRGRSRRRARRPRSGGRAATRAAPGTRPPSRARGRTGPRARRCPGWPCATAAATGWPPNVKPWMNMFLPSMNGSATLSERDHGAHRRVGGGQALGGGDHVRLVAVALGAEVVCPAGPTSR